eukprot:m.106637 g.106637  ORF g.106637 m.106637 type:complete len:435 (-) comp15790_c0_seq1:31-1335(-)
MAAEGPPFKIGCKVQLSDGRTGTMKFFGRVAAVKKTLCGVALDEPEGKNDGSLGGVRYFACRPDHGVFVPARRLSAAGAGQSGRRIKSPRRRSSSKDNIRRPPQYVVRSFSASPPKRDPNRFAPRVYKPLPPRAESPPKKAATTPHRKRSPKKKVKKPAPPPEPESEPEPEPESEPEPQPESEPEPEPESESESEPEPESESESEEEMPPPPVLPETSESETESEQEEQEEEGSGPTAVSQGMEWVSLDGQLPEPTKRACDCECFLPHKFKEEYCAECFNLKSEHTEEAIAAGLRRRAKGSAMPDRMQVHEAEEEEKLDLGDAAERARKAAEIAAKLPTAQGCAVCNRPVYFMEQVEVHGHKYHKRCFKCATCKKSLTPTTYKSLKGVIYCRAHYDEVASSRMASVVFNSAAVLTAAMRWRALVRRRRQERGEA